MAKIKYFENPLDESGVEIISKGTLRHALRELGIENSPLCVTINGMTPEDVDVDIVLDDSDFIEVRRLVHGGGGNAQTKQGAAQIIQIASLIAITVLSGGSTSPWLIAAIAVGGSVAAGALNKWAQDLMAANSASASEQEINSQTNNYSAKTATNKARPLSPVTLPIGSHKYAPDIHADAYVTRYRMNNSTSMGAPYVNNSRIYGIISSNGPMAINNSWITMPANYISAGTPEYEIKISPYGIVNKTTALTSAENIAACEIVKSWFNDGISNGVLKSNLNAFSFGTQSKAIMPVAYHSSPSDPYVGRFNFLFIVMQYSRLRYYLGLSTTWSDIGDIFAGSLNVLRRADYFGYDSLSIASDPLTVTTSNSNTLPAGVRGYNANQRADEFRNRLLSLNNGFYDSSSKTVSYPSQELLFSPSIAQTFSGIPVSTQVFNYGVGDLVVSDRKVGDFSIAPNDGILENKMINKTGVNKWKIPSFSKFSQTFRFYEDVRNFPPKELTNSGSTPTVVSNLDHGKYNFVYYSGKYRQDTFSFAFKGRLYRTSPSGFSANTTHVQVQYKLSGDANWRNMSILGFQYEVITLENNNTQEIYLRYELNLNSPSYNSDQYLEVRIRKVTLDSVDNVTISSSDSRVSMLSIVDASFTSSDVSSTYGDLYYLNRPMNLEGLAIDSLISDTARSNEFTATVEAKCWVYDFDNDSWAWSTTRNPAFWFLYFARGGFLNDVADGQLSSPYSPTYGWVNYPDHPSNTEIIFGGGYKDSEIDIDKILEWAYFCDQHNLKIDMVIRDDTSVADILERIANVGRASVSYSVGVLSVVIEDPEQIPKTLFGMANIKAGTFSVDYAVGDPVRKVSAQFTNRSTWETDTVSSFVPFSDPTVIKEIKITIDGVTEKDQAQREVNILAARQFFQKRNYSWESDQEGYDVNRGDLVYLSHDSTQYGFSGRAMEFILESGNIVGMRTGSILDSSVQFVTIRRPDGVLNTYRCSYDKNTILFLEHYDLSDAPYYLNNGDINSLSDIPESIAEDFVFIADIKETTGKVVRISEKKRSANDGFIFTAVDEDPAMWSFEYGDPTLPQSFDDSVYISKIENVSWTDLGEGKVEIFWNASNSDAIMIIDESVNLPIESNGLYSFTGGSVVLELTPGVQYNVEIIPINYGMAFKTVTERVKLWPL